MSPNAANPARKPRADATRNRERLLETAAEIFSAGGPDASLEAVAKRAGVGIGTLYRHFPTREALFDAVYRREVDQLGELADGSRAKSRRSKLRRWLHANVRLVATKRAWSRRSRLRPTALRSFTRIPGPPHESRRFAHRSRREGRRHTRISRPKTSCARLSACPTTSTAPQIGQPRRCVSPNLRGRPPQALTGLRRLQLAWLTGAPRSRGRRATYE